MFVHKLHIGPFVSVPQQYSILTHVAISMCAPQHPNISSRAPAPEISKQQAEHIIRAKDGRVLLLTVRLAF